MSASTLRASHDQRKKELINELNVVLKAAASHRGPNKEPLAQELTANLCAVVEALFIHGLRDPFFLRGSRYAKYPEPNFWPFVSKFSHRSVTTQIYALSQIKTEIGKARTWVRLVLNEGGLEHYLGVLAAEKKALSQFYVEEAFIRDSEHVERTKDMLRSLAAVHLAAPTNSSLLNSWTPSPLILAGLVDGKPLRVSQQAVQHRRIPSKEDQSPEELGICALELLPASSTSPLQQGGLKGAAAAASSSSSSAALRVPLSLSMAGSGSHGVASSSPSSHSSLLFLRAGLQKPSPRGRFEEADDASSIYSHPSMVAEGRTAAAAAARTSEGSTGGEGLVQRRTKRRRNMSRSSSDGSGSNGANQQRRTAAAAAAAAKQTTTPIAAAAAAAAKAAAGEQMRPLDGETEEERRRRDSGVESEVNHASVSGCPIVSSVSEEPAVRRAEEPEEESEKTSTEHDKEEEETMFEMSGDRETLEEMQRRQEEGSSESPEMREKEEEEGEDGDEYVEEYQMASSSSHQKEEDEGVASLSGNSLIGRSWRMSNRASSTDAASELQQLQQLQQPQMGDEDAFEGAEVALSPSDLLLATTAIETTPLSTSASDTDGSLPAAVSFGAALRRHVAQQAGPGVDVLIRRRDFSDSTEDGEEEEEDEEMMMVRKELEDAETLRKLTEIATESGLDAQEFRCAMCKSTVGTPSYRPYNVCALDARYYCGECWQQGAERVVPSRLITSWDARTRKVSPRSCVFLDTVGDRPLIHLHITNPTLYAHSKAVREVKELREKLQLVAMYLFNCRESVAADLRRRLAPKEYFIDDVHLYSYNDLLAVVSGSMARQLKIMLKYAIGHVFDCGLCSQKGFHCEMCHEGAVIYPFQTEITHRCGECYTVSHLECFEKTHACVKCERRRKYSATRREATHLEIDC